MLYSKPHFAVRHAASKDATRLNLNGVRFNSDGSTEATNGHFLCKYTPAEGGESADDYPTVEGVERTAESVEAFTLPLETTERALRSIPKGRQSMPILGNVLLDVAASNSNGKAKFVSTDLKSVTATEGRKIEGDFPDTSKVRREIPESESPAFAINLDYLVLIAKAAKEVAGKNAIGKFYPGADALSVVTITVECPDTGKLETVIMPVQTEESRRDRKAARE